MAIAIVWFILIGALAGWVAGELTRGHGFGFIGNMVVGILGSLLGGFIFNLLNIAAIGLLPQLITAVVGAVIFLFVLSLFRHGGETRSPNP